jgi:hypothetical protein
MELSDTHLLKNIPKHPSICNEKASLYYHFGLKTGLL